MSRLLAALDNHTKKQFGENAHVEYGWSNNIKERILQFSFQLVRCDNEGTQKLQHKLHDILFTLTEKKMDNETKQLLSILYKMIGHTRDIIDGKGECTLTYMMIYTWYKFNPTLALYAVKCLIQEHTNINENEDDQQEKQETKFNTHPYGCWKDIKYFCEYCSLKGLSLEHPLIKYAIQLSNDQLKADYEKLENNNTNISLVAKWIPREKSHFSWLYEAFAINYFSHYLLTTNGNPEKRFKAMLKCKTEYRKLLSKLNKHLDTLQIKQCGKLWASIDFHNVTSVSLSKQKKAFLNTTKTGEVRFPDNEDRAECAVHFKEHIQKAVKGEIEVKGKRLGMEQFTAQASELLSKNNFDQDEIDLLNLQWQNNSSQTKSLTNMIAMVDVSGSMEGDPMNVAVALGIRIAEKSALGKRVMTFSSTPKWVNLEPYNDFVSQVQIVLKTDWGMNTNFNAALNMILDAIIENKMPAEDVQDMMLVILSDMQIDGGDNCDKDVLYQIMETKYAEAGVRSIGKPYKPPHILFWNLRSTDGFPSLSYQPNVSMMSGFSPSLLNLFCEQGLNALQSCTPWSILEKSLENVRYKIMQDKIDEIIV